MSHDVNSQNGTLRGLGTTSSSLLREIDNDRRSTLRDVRYGTTSSYISEHHKGTVFIRVSVPELKVQKCLQFELDETVWDAKQRILTIFSKDLKDALNYGLYMPPMNGRAGKFLDEERTLREYPLHGPIGFLEFKYKRRVYKIIHLNPRKLKQLHNKTNFRQFIEHVKNANLSKINKFTNRGLDPNFHDSSGETPLCHAVSLPKDKCREVIITLVSGGGHIDYRNRHGQTPMHKAILQGNQSAVKTLLDLGASTNYKDGGGLTPLYYSVLYGKSGSCAEMLLHERALIGVRDEQGWYEIHQACKLGLVQHLEHLMFYGADLDVTNASGNTALHICAINNNEQCARILLFRGADKHILNYNNQTPQQVAIIAGNIAIAEMIKEFDDSEVVQFREIPSFSTRRTRLSMYASTLSLSSRSRSDPKLNITSAIDDSNITSPPSSMRSLPQHYNNVYSDSGSCSASRDSDSPRSMSISSNSSGPGVLRLNSSPSLTNPSPLSDCGSRQKTPHRRCFSVAGNLLEQAISESTEDSFRDELQRRLQPTAGLNQTDDDTIAAAGANAAADVDDDDDDEHIILTVGATNEHNSDTLRHRSSPEVFKFPDVLNNHTQHEQSLDNRGKVTFYLSSLDKTFVCTQEYIPNHPAGLHLAEGDIVQGFNQFLLRHYIPQEIVMSYLPLSVLEIRSNPDNATLGILENLSSYLG